MPSDFYALCEPPFDPFSICHIKYLTWKTVFLVAMPTAAKVCELQAFQLIPIIYVLKVQGLNNLKESAIFQNACIQVKLLIITFQCL